VRKETRSLVPSTRARFPRKLTPRSFATSARSMKVHTPCTTPRIVEGTRRMEQKNPISAPQKKAKKTNHTKHSFAQLSKKMDRLEMVIKKHQTKETLP
jgi:hypothetical protein